MPKNRLLVTMIDSESLLPTITNADGNVDIHIRGYNIQNPLLQHLLVRAKSVDEMILAPLSGQNHTVPYEMLSSRATSPVKWDKHQRDIIGSFHRALSQAAQQLACYRQECKFSVLTEMLQDVFTNSPSGTALLEIETRATEQHALSKKINLPIYSYPLSMIHSGFKRACYYRDTSELLGIYMVMQAVHLARPEDDISFELYGASVDKLQRLAAYFKSEGGTKLIPKASELYFYYFNVSKFLLDSECLRLLPVSEDISGAAVFDYCYDDNLERPRLLYQAPVVGDGELNPHYRETILRLQENNQPETRSGSVDLSSRVTPTQWYAQARADQKAESLPPQVGITSFLSPPYLNELPELKLRDEVYEVKPDSPLPAQARTRSEKKRWRFFPALFACGAASHVTEPRSIASEKSNCSK